MKQTWLALLLIAGLLLTGCKAITETTDQETKNEFGCTLGVCIKDTYAFVDEEYFIVLFDITPINGIKNVDTAPQFTTPVQIVVTGADGTEYINQTYTQEEYYCYVGTDVPWAAGNLTATCGIGIPISAASSVPAAGDEISISIPEFGEYAVRVVVGNQF